MNRRGTGIIGCLVFDITKTLVNRFEHGLPGARVSLLFVSGIEIENDLHKAHNFLKSHNAEGILLCHHIPVRQDFNIQIV